MLEFSQSQWFKQYFEFNTLKRIEAEKMLKKMEKTLMYKLMNNAVYEKTMENIFKK